MQPSNQKGLIWGQRQECGQAVETAAALMEFVEFHTGELREVGDVVAAVCCVWSESYAAANKDLCFGTRSHRTGQLTAWELHGFAALPPSATWNGNKLYTYITGQCATHAAMGPMTETKPEAIRFAPWLAWSQPYLEVIRIFPLVYLATE